MRIAFKSARVQALVVAGLLACRSAPIAPPSAPLVDAGYEEGDRPLEATEWAISRYLDGETAIDLGGSEPPRIRFAPDTSWRARSACLELSGRYSLEGERGIRLLETRANETSCSGEAAAVAQRLRAVLADGAVTYEIDARELVLWKDGTRGLQASVAPASGAVRALIDRSFVLQSKAGADVLTGTHVHVHFTRDGLSVRASCNHMSGAYTLEAERVVVGSMMQTEMGCDEQRHAQDDWLQRFFAAKPKLRLEGNTLTLSNESASLTFLDREIADPDRPLQGTVWEINQYIEGDSVMGLMDIENPRLTFAADGTWQARAKCLDARGQYTLDGARIRLTGTQVAQGACVDNDNEAAAFTRSVLVDGTLTFAIDARSLTLKGSGARSLGAIVRE